jgi:hypothetical protein
MPARLLILTGVAVLLLLALVPACESTDVTAPANSTIILQAVPASVLINQDAGETQGSTQIYALILDKGGQPLKDIPVIFTSTAGRLDSENFCNISNECTRTGAACTDDTDCPPPSTPAVKTNDEGVAIDRLTLRLFQDTAATADVTATTSVISQKVTVTKIVALGPVDPVAVITANPASGQRTGLPFSFDGSSSTFDPQVELTCFEWVITSNLDWTGGECIGLCVGKTQTIRGPDKASITLHVDEDQVDLSAQLRVSDVDNVVCNNVTTPSSNDFSKPKTISYQIRCDLTDPVVDAGPNQFASLAAHNGEVPITLTATASDPESGPMDYQWDCGNGEGGSQQSVVCTYTSEGIYTAKVIVTNDCGRASQDGLNVNINP